MTAHPHASTSRRRQRYEEQRRARKRRLIMVMVAVPVAALLAVLIVMVATGGEDEPSARLPGTTLELTLGEYSIAGDLSVPAGVTRIHAVNVGVIAHNVGVRGVKISGNIAAGEDLVLELGDLRPGTYELYCDLVGHEQAGMVATLTVAASATPGSAAA